MITGIMGQKIGMTQFFNNRGKCLPGTLIKILNSTVIEIKNKNTHGYNSILIKNNFEDNSSNNSKRKILYKEFRIKNTNKFCLKEFLNLNLFNTGEKIYIKAKTTGKGNCGNIKKNHFKRGPMTHGSKHHRLQGSLGAGTTPSRVFPGKKMAGRLGNRFQTLKNLEILKIDSTNNLILVKGSVPGKFGNFLTLIKKDETFNL